MVYGVRLLLKSQACSDYGFDSHGLFPHRVRNRNFFTNFIYQWWGYGVSKKSGICSVSWQSQAHIYMFDTHCSFYGSLSSLVALLRCRNHSTRKLILVKESAQKRVAQLYNGRRILDKCNFPRSVWVRFPVPVWSRPTLIFFCLCSISRNCTYLYRIA